MDLSESVINRANVIGSFVRPERAEHVPLRRINPNDRFKGVKHHLHGADDVGIIVIGLLDEDWFEEFAVITTVIVVPSGVAHRI